MSGKKLAHWVSVEGADGNAVLLKPGTTVPSWAKDKVTNPKAFVADSDESDDGDESGGDAGTGDGQTPASTPPAGGELASTPDGEATEEPEKELPYGERAYRSLQIAAKLRGLPGDGNQEALVARLEADDREKNQK